MSSTQSLLDALDGISERVTGEMSEKDVENAFLNEGLYAVLGYSGGGYGAFDPTDDGRQVVAERPEVLRA